jgi:hypothetical protein
MYNMIHAIRNIFILKLVLRSIVLNPIFIYCIGSIRHIGTKLINFLFPIKKAIDLKTNKSVLMQVYINYWFSLYGFKISDQPEIMYDKLFIQYASNDRNFKTILCCQPSDAKFISTHIAKHPHIYPKIFLNNGFILESVHIDTINILPMMQNFVNYNVVITLGDILKIYKINHNNKSMKITYYENFNKHDIIVNNIAVHLSKNICNSILMIVDNLEPTKDNSETIILDNIYNDLEPKKGGLIDSFGPRSIPNYSECMICTTCDLSMIYCPLHFGRIDECHKTHPT